MPRSGSKKSGFLNIPARLLLKEKDNATGSYPTILRMGDKDRRGSYTTQFDDTNTIAFGRRIRDNFELRDEDRSEGILGFSRKINSNHWSHTEELEIRKELITAVGGSTVQDGALVLAGAGDSQGRWIQTKNKIKNPTLTADIIFGPYNVRRTALKFGLGLNDPGASEDRGLKIQVSTSGFPGTWTTLKTLTGDTDKLFTSSSFTSFESFKDLLQKRKRVKIKMTPSDFDSVGSSEFYLRFIQTTVTNSNQAEWAIGYVNIDYHNEEVRYPIMIDPTSRVGQKVVSGAIATPHILPTITAPGRSISGISDIHMKFTPGEGVSPFEDSRIKIEPENFIFQQGTDPDVFSGMSSPLWSKTQIVVDLSPNEQTTFGLTTPATTADSTDETDDKIKQQLMVYWNNTLRRWEKIAQGVSGNPATGSLVSMIASGAVGFSGIDMVSTGSTADYANQNVLSTNVLNSYVRPTSTFGFPFEGKYHASSSQTVKARDLGINKPFVLEKCSIEFDSKFEFGESGTNAEHPYSLLYGTADSNPSGRSIDEQQRIYIPTFFILKQQDYDNFNVLIDYDLDRNGAFYKNKRKVSIPTAAVLSSDNTVVTPVSSSRELITYGQTTLFVSSSITSKAFEIREVLDGGLSRDSEYNILTLNGQTGSLGSTEDVSSLTGSFSITFPCRTTGKIEGGSRMSVIDDSQSPVELRGLWLDNKLGGRAYGNLDSSARAIVNGFAALEKAGTYQSFATNFAHLPLKIEVATAESSDIQSPYLIYPEDNIIFGWQYPMSNMLWDRSPGSGANKFHSMTLFQNSKLTLFGSQLKDKKEFHETVNQNLGSNNVHEVIGNESVVDQFEVSKVMENFGNYLDSFVTNDSENPVDRVGSTVQSRLTTAKGSSNKGQATITFPTTSLLFGVPTNNPGMNDGDRIAIKDALGNVAHFYGYRNSKTSPVADDLDTGTVSYGTAARYDSDGDGSTDSLLSSIAWGSDKYHRFVQDSNVYGLRWDGSDGTIEWPRRYLLINQGFDHITGPGVNDTADAANIFSFKIEGGDTSGTRYTIDELNQTLENLLLAIEASSLRVTGEVTTSSSGILSSPFLTLTLMDAGSAGQYEITYAAGDNLDYPGTNINFQTDYDVPSVAGFEGGNDLLDSSLGSFVRIAPTKDETRVYADSLLANNQIGESNSSFGTMQTSGKELRPKYYLSARKFGQSADFIEQAKDGKTKSRLTGLSQRAGPRKGVALQAPVFINFVSGTISNSTAVKTFALKSPSDAVNKTFNSSLTGSYYDPDAPDAPTGGGGLPS